MTPLDSICCTCVIFSRRTAGLWRRYGWRSCGPSVSIVCWSSGVQPKSSSPWLIMSLNSWKRAFSCCCCASDRCSGTSGWRVWLEAGGGGGELRGRRSPGCPRFVLCVSGEFGAMIMNGDPTSDPLVRAGTLETNVGRPTSGQKYTSSLGQGLWQQTNRVVLAGMSTACSSRAWLTGGVGVWAALRCIVCGFGWAGVAVPWVTSIWTRRGRMMSIPISTGGDSRPMITMKLALPLASPHCRFRCWVFHARRGRPPQKASKDPIGFGLPPHRKSHTGH